MKKIFRLVIALGLFSGAFMFTGCNYENDINALDDRLSAVESSIQDLQKKIEEGAVISSVTPGENGVVITLSNGNSYTITNGTDGTNGTPGSVITIGEDGYWYIDGVKTDYPAQGTPGKDGQNGQNGQDGQDASTVYYYPHESGFWYKVTIDPDGNKTEEATQISWIATANGVTAVYNPVDGTLTLANVDGSEEPIVINLNSQLKSLAFVPETMTQGLGLIQFYSLYDAKGAFIVANHPEVTYRVNPQNADLSKIDWAFINRDVTTKVAGDETDLISIIGEPVAAEEGGLVFTITANSDKDIPEDASAVGENVLVALQATASDTKEEVVSDYSFVEQEKVDQFSIIKYAPYYAKTKKVVPYYVAAADAAPALSVDTNITLGYDETINVFDSLETYAPQVDKSLPEMYVEPSYKLTFPEKYLGADGKTNQQQFVTLDTKTGELSVDSEWLSQSTRPAIGRTPVIYVESFVKNTKGEDVKVAECWLKVKIVGEEVEINDLHVQVAAKTIEYAEIPAAGAQIALSWEQANTDILAALGLTYKEFTALYDVNAANVALTWYDENGKKLDAAPNGVTTNISGLGNETATNAAVVTITKYADEDLEGSVEVVIPSIEPQSRGDVVVTFTYTVKHDHVWPELSANYLKPGTTNTVQVKGKLVGNKWVMTSAFAEHFDSYLKDYAAAYAKDSENHGPIMFYLPMITPDGDAVTLKQLVENKVPEGSKDQAGARVDGTDYTDQTITLTTPLEGASKTYVVCAYTQLANGNYCEKFYNVEFVSPFVVEGADVSLKTLVAEPSTQDLQKQLVVKDLDGKVVFEKGAATTYGTNTYKLAAADFDFDYALVFNNDKNEYPDYNREAEFGGNLTEQNGVVTWDNEGTTLQQDMHAGYEITLTVSDICVIDDIANITVLSSANSK